jgi:hypothetical protein
MLGWETILEPAKRVSIDNGNNQIPRIRPLCPKDAENPYLVLILPQLFKQNLDDPLKRRNHRIAVYSARRPARRQNNYDYNLAWQGFYG